MKEKVQCSRCLYIQEIDSSDSIAITCEMCGEIDAAYTGKDIIHPHPFL